MSKPALVLLGGHGKVSLQFTRLASQRYQIYSVIRDAAHEQDIKGVGGTPIVQSLEDSTVQDFASLLKSKSPSFVVWSAGAGGKGGPERTDAVDHKAFVRVLDAIETLDAPRPRFLTVSAIDTRDVSKPVPSHYTQTDLERSKAGHDSIGGYYDAKLKADLNLIKRTLFPWVILRPGALSDEEATGKVAVGHVPLTPKVSRADVAAVILELLERDDAIGQALDLVSGTQSIKEAVGKAIRNKESFAY